MCEAFTCLAWPSANIVAQVSLMVSRLCAGVSNGRLAKAATFGAYRNLSLHSKVADIDVYHFIANHQLQYLLANFSGQRKQW